MLILKLSAALALVVPAQLVGGSAGDGFDHEEG